MSFILDALKKSETERQEQGSAEFVNVPASGEPRREGPPAWLWVLGALLLINLVVLAGIMLRPDVGSARPDSVSASPASPPVTDTAAAALEQPRAESRVPANDDFAERVAAARATELPREEPTTASEPAIQPVGVSSGSVRTEAAPAGINTATLPTIHEVAASGRISVGELHVDIHVFSENAADRFVFINMTKYNEGARLAEGPLVEEITPDGVVLSHDGVTFLVPRD